MKKIQIIPGLLGAAFLLAGPAFAADVAVWPVRAAPPPVIVVPVYNWTGFYIGGNIGGVHSDASGTSDFIDTSVPIGSVLRSNPQNNSFSNSSFLGGFQAGFNWQFDQWVVGVEGDWDWGRTRYSFCRQTNVESVPCIDNEHGFETIASRLNWLATIRGRAGFLVAPWLLVYGTAGGAGGDIDTTLSQSCLVKGCGESGVKVAISPTTSETKSGWVAGAGIEALINNHWMLRGEWLHVDLGTLSNAFSTPGTGGSFQTTTWSRTEKFDEFRAALSYKF